MRIGFGTDLHRLEAGDGIVLGCVKIACDYSFVAHSDGDVLLHAVTDAILGAIAEGDIGELFPDTDEQNCNRDSGEFLAEAVKRMQQAGFAVGNLDCVIHAEQPRLMPYKAEMASSIAVICNCDRECVNVKAKTGEGIAPIGAAEAIMAEALVLLIPVEKS